MKMSPQNEIIQEIKDINRKELQTIGELIRTYISKLRTLQTVERDDLIAEEYQKTMKTKYKKIRAILLEDKLPVSEDELDLEDYLDEEEPEKIAAVVLDKITNIPQQNELIYRKFLNLFTNIEKADQEVIIPDLLEKQRDALKKELIQLLTIFRAET